MVIKLNNFITSSLAYSSLVSGLILFITNCFFNLLFKKLCKKKSSSFNRYSGQCAKTMPYTILETEKTTYKKHSFISDQSNLPRVEHVL